MVWVGFFHSKNKDISQMSIGERCHKVNQPMICLIGNTSGEKHPSITTDPWHIVYKRGLEDEAIKTVVYYKGFFEAC